VPRQEAALEQKDKKVNQDLVFSLRDLLAQLALPAPKGFAVTMVLQEILVFQETLVHQGVMVYPVKRVLLDHLADTS